jgi:uncharacterized protein
MKCPVCETVHLLISDRQGVEIDYCPQCRGVWLDRGELDKIIERSTSFMPATPPQRQERQERQDNQGYERQQRQERQDSQGYERSQQSSYHDSKSEQPKHDYKKKKREGFLSELFDFD